MDVDGVFDASYQRVLESRVAGRDFFETFYDRFLSASDEVAETFRDTDMARQQAMLKASFYHLVSFYGASDADYYLRRVAISHNRYHRGIRPGLYALWLETLIATLREHDADCDAETELAWRLVMAPGIVYMVFHYDRETPVGQPDA
ncbi:globin [Onishia taeanensis]